MTSPGVLKRVAVLCVLASVAGAVLKPSTAELKEHDEASTNPPVLSPKKSSMLTKFQTVSNEEEENLVSHPSSLNHNAVKNSSITNNVEDNTETTVGQNHVSSDQESSETREPKKVENPLKPFSPEEKNQNENSTKISSSAPGDDASKKAISSKTHFAAQDSTALSGNEPSSGPSPQRFGSAGGSFPVVFPQPINQRRENFNPLPVLERGAVDEHFTERSLKEAAVQEQQNLADELLSTSRGDHSSDKPTFDVRVRTPRPGKKPMLMELRPKALNGGSPKRLFLDSPSVSRPHHKSAHRARIGVEAKGDNGQIKRLPDIQDDQSLLHLLQQDNRQSGFIDPRGSFFSTPGITNFLKPHIPDDLIFRQSNSLIHQNQDFFAVTPSSAISASTLGPGLIGLNTPEFGFSPRQLPTFDEGRNIFHRPTLSPNQFVDGQVIFNDNRRPLTSEHFVNLNDQHLSSFVTPREPNLKLPFNNRFFGGEKISSNISVERPASFPASGRPFLGLGEPFVPNPNNFKDNSFALRPVSPRPSTLNEPLNPATFFNFIPSTPSDSFDHFSGVGGLGNVVTPGSISYHSTPQPIHVVHEQSVTPSPFDYLPTTPFPGSGLNPVTFRSTNLPIITTTHRPIISSTYDPIIRSEFSKVKGPHSGRGASRYRPPQTALRNPNILTKFDPPFDHHADISSQYHSGEHLSHGTNNQVSPWTAEQDLVGDGDHKEYRYHYAVHSSSTGDHKSAHETKLPDGTVVGGYSLLQPDGITRKVTYTADKYSGFQANVEYLPPRPALTG